MRRHLPVLLAMALASAVSATDIQTVDSWSHYRELLASAGHDQAEVDRRVAEGLASLNAMDRDAGSELIGVAAPPFRFDAWLNTPGLSLEELRGKVLLVRWWTDTCPFCASSAPALRTLHTQYAGQGLVLIGVFHPKAGRDDPLDLPRVQRAADTRRFEFPIAVDWGWRTGTLQDWWLTGPERPATSVTFLVDKNGIIRFVHPGMEYHDAADTDPGEDPADHAMCAQDMTRIRTTIERLLAE